MLTEEVLTRQRSFPEEERAGMKPVAVFFPISYKPKLDSAGKEHEAPQQGSGRRKQDRDMKHHYKCSKAVPGVSGCGSGHLKMPAALKHHRSPESS